MPNKSHFNSGHMTMNKLKKDGLTHSSSVEFTKPERTFHGLFLEDAVEFLKKLPDSSVQLILIDPPYNIDLAHWDTFHNYLEWAKQWLDEVYRVLDPKGNCVIFGGFQYQDLKKGDLLEIMHYQYLEPLYSTL
jgi:DNA modification methylase